MSLRYISEFFAMVFISNFFIPGLGFFIVLTNVLRFRQEDNCTNNTIGTIMYNI